MANYRKTVKGKKINIDDIKTKQGKVVPLGNKKTIHPPTEKPKVKARESLPKLHSTTPKKIDLNQINEDAKKKLDNLSKTNIATLELPGEEITIVNDSNDENSNDNEIINQSNKKGRK